MENIGILVVSYGSRAASIVDAFSRSNYNVKLYIADKQKNPFNLEKAHEHVVIPDLSVDKICEGLNPAQRRLTLASSVPKDLLSQGYAMSWKRRPAYQWSAPQKNSLWRKARSPKGR